MKETALCDHKMKQNKDKEPQQVDSCAAFEQTSLSLAPLSLLTLMSSFMMRSHHFARYFLVSQHCSYSATSFVVLVDFQTLSFPY